MEYLYPYPDGVGVASRVVGVGKLLVGLGLGVGCGYGCLVTAFLTCQSVSLEGLWIGCSLRG